MDIYIARMLMGIGEMLIEGGEMHFGVAKMGCFVSGMG
jgi:hypothetical protein